MKYLKLFEKSYYQELSKIKYSLQILGDDYKGVENWRTFTKEETTQLKNLFPNSNILFDNQNNISEYYHAVLKIDNLQITKLQDEWYFIFVPTNWDNPKFNHPNFVWSDEDDKFYKCDQFEGLLKFLKNILK